jgi:tyrosine-protein phosphatase SIW14
MSTDKNLPNLNKVSDDLFRGGQPTRQGFIILRTLGIKTIINLRWLHTDLFRIRELGFKYFHISCKAWHPEEEDVNRFMDIITNLKKPSTFVHCQHGADRTGVMVAAYRIFIQGWEVAAAIEEMTQGPFGFHRIFQNLPEFLEKYKKT